MYMATVILAKQVCKSMRMHMHKHSGHTISNTATQICIGQSFKLNDTCYVGCMLVSKLPRRLLAVQCSLMILTTRGHTCYPEQGCWGLTKPYGFVSSPAWPVTCRAMIRLDSCKTVRSGLKVTADITSFLNIHTKHCKQFLQF